MKKSAGRLRYVLLSGLSIILLLINESIFTGKMSDCDHSGYEKNFPPKMIMQGMDASEFLYTALSFNGNAIVSDLSDYTMEHRSIDRSLLKILKGHSFGVHIVAFSPAGKAIASGSIDNTIILWSIDGRLIRSVRGHPGSSNKVASLQAPLLRQ